MAKEIEEGKFDTHVPEKWNVEELIATRDFRGDDMIMKRIAEQDRAAGTHGEKLKWTAPKEDDLVMVRRHEIVKQKGMKLEYRWDGPRVVVKVSGQGNSATVKELHGEKTEKRYHVDDLKVYVTRRRGGYMREECTGEVYETGLAEEGEAMLKGREVQ